jgi:hypothetical protein
VPARVSSHAAVPVKRMIEKYFAGRTLVIATMHGKEKVLAPLLEQNLGVHVVVPHGLDTDAFGTFSGEIERKGSPLQAAGKKCNTAYEITGQPLVLASEGSFGPHPQIGFIAANEELLLLRDYKNGFEIKASVLSTSTNFSGQVLDKWEDVRSYAEKIGFPSHGLILRPDSDLVSEIHKGIKDWKGLSSSFYYFKKRWGKAHVETDMRAHYNPTRMKVVGEAGQKLLDLIMQTCPVCEGPGFAVTETVPGLPCGLCGIPTKTAKAHIHSCQHCGHTQIKKFPDNKDCEDPMFCDECNP